jgi:hypothetical protein
MFGFDPTGKPSDRMVNQPANIPNADGYDHDYGGVKWVCMLIGDHARFRVLPGGHCVSHRSG